MPSKNCCFCLPSKLVLSWHYYYVTPGLFIVVFVVGLVMLSGEASVVIIAPVGGLSISSGEASVVIITPSVGGLLISLLLGGGDGDGLTLADGDTDAEILALGE